MQKHGIFGYLNFNIYQTKAIRDGYFPNYVIIAEMHFKALYILRMSVIRAVPMHFGYNSFDYNIYFSPFTVGLNITV